MLRQTGFVVAPEGLASLIVGVAVQTCLGIESALIGYLQLIDSIVVDFGDSTFLLILCRSGDRSCQRAEGQSHEDAVEPYLVGVDGFVPEYLVGNGAWLVVQLFHHGLHGQQVLRLGPVLIHAGDEMSGTDVVEIVVQHVISSDVALLVNHLVGVHLAVVVDVLTAIAEVGVQHALQFDAHDVRPLGLLGEVEHVRLWNALHLGIGEPLGVVLVRHLLQDE